MAGANQEPEEGKREKAAVAVRAPAPVRLLYANVLIVATCGLVYELLAGTLGSYLLGDSVTQFSLVIGLYLSAMGVGAWLSRYVEGNLARRFIDVELCVALVGGLSAPLLFLAFSKVQHFQVLLLGFVLVIGTLVGLELPLLMRLVRTQVAFKDLVSRVLTFDYAGALGASLLFPLFLVPKLGLVRTSLVIGLVNALVALWGTWLLANQIGHTAGLRIRASFVVGVLTVGVALSPELTRLSESEMYADAVVHAETSKYQRIVVTRSRSGFQLFLNGNLQFASADEYRYHEALVHPALLARKEQGTATRHVLILGGGDGLGLREVLKHRDVQTVTLVDLDPRITQLGQQFPPLAKLNGHAFDDPRLRLHNDDALVWLAQQNELWDAAIVDFPDPNTFSLGKLYTRRFFRLLASRLTQNATVAIQATSPLFARRSYWCVVETMRAAGLFVKPYHATVPSFGEWGFVLAMKRPFDAPTLVPSALALRFVNQQSLPALFQFSTDMLPVPVEINRLNDQRLVHYYEAEWQRWQ